MKSKKIIEAEEEEHRSYHRKLLYILLLILILLFGSATFYHYVEKWRYIDSLYFASATMTTVGYGDITPKTDFGKLFTVFFVFMGVGVALYGISVIASHFVEVREEFWIQRLEKINLRRHTGTFWGKIKDLFNYKKDSIVKEYEKSIKKK